MTPKLIVAVAGYAFTLYFFRLLGGFGSAGRAVQRWGQASSRRRMERSGLAADEFSRARLGRRS